VRKLTLFLSLVLLSASATRAENPPEPTALSATVSANLVTIANCSVGKPVILFGVMREPQRYHSRLSRPAVTATADASGAVTFDSFHGSLAPSGECRLCRSRLHDRPIRVGHANRR
jgi:hypothetical protein